MSMDTMEENRRVNDYSTFEQEYVELIYQLLKDNPVARIKDIAKLRDVASPTVTVAIDRLRKSGLVEHEKSGYVVLTEEGQNLASRLERRHGLIREFLNDILGVNCEIAETDACNIEHILDRQSVDRLEEFLEFARESQCEGESWLSRFKKRRG
ncbi:MAG: winged helix-turn-helix transcriptional regulator [candidate division Zixibacteria bacterium]|nr:winged helix-turn-helix transcriptional regulator [candidate division Zixibacteria bacterium]